MAFFLLGCSSDSTTPTPTVPPIPVPFILTSIPSDTTQLFEAKGPPAQDTVLIYAEGGPRYTFETRGIEDDHFSSYYRVYVKQAQQISTSIGTSSKAISFEQAIGEDSISAVVFQRALQYFKRRGKYVVALSHSFGSFILPFVINNFPKTADQFIIMAGRLDMNDVVWQNFRDGQLYSFPDGITPTANVGIIATGKELSATRLQAGLGKNRYTTLLADNDLGNVVYVYGTKDKAVGSLTSSEVDFLKSKQAHVFSITDGDHSSMFDSKNLDSIISLIRRP